MIETTFSVAGLTVKAIHFYPAFPKFAAEYLSDAPADVTVTVTRELIAEEARASLPEIYPEPYLEAVVIYRLLAGELPKFGGFVFHGAVLAMDGKAYAFTARSGTGKTTHIRLWQQVFGERVHVLNGDKPILRKIDGVCYACGTPWRGKENYGKNEMLPLDGIAFLSRGAENTAKPIDKTAAAVPFLAQIYMPKSPMEAVTTMTLADEVLSAVKKVAIAVNMQPEAASVAAGGFGIEI